jgi:protein-arginine kinase activator protein McsA
MKLSGVIESQLLKKPGFLLPLLEIHAELKKKVLIPVIQRLQQVQQVTFRSKTFCAECASKMNEAFATPGLFTKCYKGFYIEIATFP